MRNSEIKEKLQNTIAALENELELQCLDPQILHEEVLNKVDITEKQYLEIMGKPYAWWEWGPENEK